MRGTVFRKWGETNAPCNGCTLRHPGCHSNCPKDNSDEYNHFGYKAFKAAADREREARSEYLKQTDALIEIHLRGKRSRGGSRT